MLPAEQTASSVKPKITNGITQLVNSRDQSGRENTSYRGSGRREIMASQDSQNSWLLIES